MPTLTYQQMQQQRAGQHPGMQQPYKGNDSGVKPSVGDMAALKILRNPANEKKLVDHIIARMLLSKTERDTRAERMRLIDIGVSGFIKLDKDDQKRRRDNEEGKKPKPTAHNLALTGAQLDEAVTYLMSVYAPEMDIFTAQSSADKQGLADGLAAAINKQGQYGQYYRELAKFCTNSIRYNFGPIRLFWEEHTGIVFQNAGGTVAKKKDVIWRGNLLKSCNAYNFFYDTSVHPVDLPRRGEYFAEVTRETPFRVQQMAAEGKLYGINRFKNTVVSVGENGNTIFYQAPPRVRDNSTAAQQNTDWSTMLREGPAKDSQLSIELISYVTWICPKEFGLSDDKDIQLWRITVAQGQFVAFAIRMDDTHGQLPCMVATPLEDDLWNDQRTYAEMLLPLQHFASFLLNTHQDATRKSLYGITVFNKQLFPGLDKNEDDLIGAKIPMKSSSGEVDIDKAFRHYTDAPDTDQNVDMVEKVMGLMQKILPTDMLKQVTDLERATLYQAASTVQAGNRRNLKIARIIYDQALVPLKLQMMYNIYSQMTTIDYIDTVSGQRQTANIADLIDAEIEFDVGTGLKGLDRLMQLQIWQTLMNAVLQSQQAIQEIDIVALLNYVSTLAGDRTDLTQFRRQTPLPQPGQGPAPAQQQAQLQGAVQ